MDFYSRRTAPKRADTWFLYALVDSRNTEAFRYIGITNNPRSRLGLHISQAQKEGWKKSRWIQSVVADGADVLMQILASGLSQVAAMDMEVALISSLRADGLDLTNLTDGGDGAQGQIQSPETRSRKSLALRGKPKSPDAVARQSESLRGRVAPAEQRAKMSAAHLARYLTDPTQRERQRANTVARFTDLAERERISELAKLRFSRNGEKDRHSATMIATLKADPSIPMRAAATRRSNGPQANNKSGFKGVFFDKSRERFAARIRVDGRDKHVGYFATAEAAARAYDAAILSHVGPLAFVNFPSIGPQVA